MRLGQRVGAFLLNWVLRGQHKERLGQRAVFAGGGHPMFLHGLQQRALRLGRRAVDLIRQNNVRENRAFHEFKLAPARFAFLQNLGTGNVTRHEVWRELNTAEAQVHDLGKRVDHQRLGQSRNPHQQAVTAGKDADQHFLNHLVLADDHLREFVAHATVLTAQLINCFFILGRNLLYATTGIGCVRI